MTDFPLPYANADLTGQVALVTGASSGLGRRFALTLAAAGASVAACGRRVEKLDDSWPRSPRRAAPPSAVPLDVSDADGHRRVPSTRRRRRSALVTILVNNAGIPDAQRAHKMSLELIDDVLDTNVRAPYVLSCEVARRLIAAETPGRIVNISSSGSFHYAGSGAALYSVSKAAVNRITEVLAVEWARFGINVNAIAPARSAPR